MTRVEMLNELREVIDDESARPKWSNRSLLGWMAEGQDKFCEETGFFRDIQTPALTTVVDQAVYSIPDRVIRILDIWNGTTKLGRLQEYMKTDPAQASQAITFNPDGQTPYCWQADQETGMILLSPTPQEVISLNLHVWRYSVNELDNDDIGGGANAEPEIPARFHRACIEWAAFKAYSNHDAEKGETLEARDHLAMFNQYVSEGKKARRRYHATEMKVGGNPHYVVR